MDMSEAAGILYPDRAPLRGTDNCPVCGRAMIKKLLPRGVTILRCDWADHITQVVAWPSIKKGVANED